LANFMPQWVHRLVLTPDAPETPAEREQVLALLSVLTRYPLLPAIKSMMHLVSGDPAWLRVRAPLVALTDAEDADLRRQVQALGLAHWPR
jgi:4-hydroxy-tetrahydrodipicolinate synthase